MMLLNALLACTLAVPNGTHLVTLVTHYAHQDPTRVAEPYVTSDSRNLTGPGEAKPVAEGHPVAFEWWVNNEKVLTCGEVPIPDGHIVFIDGFETGDLSAWSRHLPSGDTSMTRVVFDAPSSMSGKNGLLRTNENSTHWLGRYLMETKKKLADLQNKRLTLKGWEEIK